MIKGNTVLISCLLVITFATSFLVFGCTSDKRAEVGRVIKKAGDQEPGTKVSWVKEGTKGEKEIIDDPQGQWAAGATASSSYSENSGTINMAPRQATGAPDVQLLSLAGEGWGPSRENAGYEWLELTYEIPVHATGIKIRETHSCGCVVMVQLKDTNGKYHLKWAGDDRLILKINWLILDFPATGYLTDTVRVTLDTTLVENWKTIDAVQLVGEPQGSAEN